MSGQLLGRLLFQPLWLELEDFRVQERRFRVEGFRLQGLVFRRFREEAGLLEVSKPGLDVDLESTGLRPWAGAVIIRNMRAKQKG